VSFLARLSVSLTSYLQANRVYVIGRNPAILAVYVLTGGPTDNGYMILGRLVTVTRAHA